MAAKTLDPQALEAARRFAAGFTDVTPLEGEKPAPVEARWTHRFDDRDDEDLAWAVWAPRLAGRGRGC